MELSILLLACLVAAVLFAVSVMARANAQAKALKASLEEKQRIEDKLTTSRKELSQNKEDLARRSKALEEAKENARRKDRREGKKTDTSEPEASTALGHGDLDKMRRALQMMEKELKDAKGATSAAQAEAEARIKGEYEARLVELSNETKRLEQELRQTKGQTRARVKGAAPMEVDLDALPANIVAELARLYRKSEQLEQMNSLTNGKAKLSQERFAELQKRYFAVCRELALSAMGSEVQLSEEQARDAAEKYLKAAEDASAKV